jgi:hypothetical protein
MAPNRIRRRVSSPPGHQGLPRRHGHRTLLELAQVPGSGVPGVVALIPAAAIPCSYFMTKPSNGMADEST